MKVSNWGGQIAAFGEILPFECPVDWAVKNIDFSEDVSAERQRFDPALSPHLIEPLNAWDFSGKIKEVTVIGIEQHGKTLLEVIGALWSMVYIPSSMMCVYPSDELALDINTGKYEPLMRRIPALAAELAIPRARRDDRYKFSNAVMFFQGAGRKIVSKSVKIRIADEVSAWGGIGGVDNFEDLRKRGRSYSESMLYTVTSVRYTSDKAWQEFLAGSQGYWTLRCQGCGELTMRSCDLLNLQFDSKYDEAADAYIPVAGSERLVCPKCGREHSESEKTAMNAGGAYVHLFPDRKELHPSFQFGVLCSLFPFMSWGRIAAKCLSSGKRSDLSALEEFDNSWRGLPYQPRKVTAQDLAGIKQHVYTEPPKREDVEAIFLVSDTQDAFSPTGVFAMDIHDNLWLLEYANIDYVALDPRDRERIDVQRKAEGLPPCTVLEDWLEREWLGRKPLMHVIDKKGHRTREIEAYAKRNSQVIMYSGTLLQRDKWTLSKNAARTVLVSARAFQADLIFYLYSQRSKASNYIFLPANLSEETLSEITCVQPDNKRKNGHFPENWEPVGDAVHDAFDVLKMAIFAVDFAVKMLKKSRFARGEAPSIKRRWENVVPSKAKNAKIKRQATLPGGSWLRG